MCCSLDTVLNCLSVIVYIVVSSIFTLFNKWVLSSDHHNFQYPITLAIIQLAFQIAVTFRLRHVFQIMPFESNLNIHGKRLILISLSLTAYLVTANTAYILVPMPVIQIVKAPLPAAIYLLRLRQRSSRLSFTKFMCLIINLTGVIVALHGLRLTTLSIYGVICLLVATVCEAQMLILTIHNRVPLHPVPGMWYIGSASLMALIIPWLSVEAILLHNDLPNLQNQVNFWKFAFANGACASALYFASEFAIRRTSAVTYHIAGIVKDCIVVFLSTFALKDSKMTNQNIIGYAVALSGSLMYHCLAWRGSRRAESTQ